MTDYEERLMEATHRLYEKTEDLMDRYGLSFNDILGCLEEVSIRLEDEYHN